MHAIYVNYIVIRLPMQTSYYASIMLNASAYLLAMPTIMLA